MWCNMNGMKCKEWSPLGFITVKCGFFAPPLALSLSSMHLRNREKNHLKNLFSMNRDRTKRLLEIMICKFIVTEGPHPYVCSYMHYTHAHKKKEEMTLSEFVDASICRSHTVLLHKTKKKLNKLYFLTLDLMFIFNLISVIFLLCVRACVCAWQVQNCLSFCSYMFSCFFFIHLFTLFHFDLNSACPFHIHQLHINAHTLFRAYCVRLGSISFQFYSWFSFYLLYDVIKYIAV